MKISVFSLFSIMLLASSLNYAKAQQYDVDYTVKFINSKLDKKCQLFNEKKNLRIEYYAGSEPVRLDFLFPESIDFENGIYYSEGEESLIVTCYDQAGKCIERELIKRNSKMLYDRSNLITTCSGEDCDGLIEAMKHLIKLYVLEDVERTEPFE